MYEISNDQSDWHWRKETPVYEMQQLLERAPHSIITIEGPSGNVTKWRRVSRNKDVITCIQNAIFTTRDLQPGIKEEAEVIYDALVRRNYISPDLLE